MAIAHVSDADYEAIGKAYAEYITANGTASVPAGSWPDVLGPSLFARAVEGGYFGPKGTLAGFPYGDLVVKGVQVSGTNDGQGGFVYTLTVDGEVVATETGDGNFDTVAFAKRHGQSI